MLRRVCKLFSLCAMLLPMRAAPALAGGDVPAYARAFEFAFQPGWHAKVGDQDVRFSVFDGGRLRLTSGRIVACDPLVNMGRPAFTVEVPNGAFPVRLALAAGGVDDGRVAFARVDFSSEPAVRWELALVPGQDAATLKADEHFGYPVDAGTGSFVDPATAAIADKKMRADEDLAQRWITEGEHRKPPMFFLDVDMGPGNIIMFHSGWGDGVYASWFGYDAQGHVAALVTDFLVIDWSMATWP